MIFRKSVIIFVYYNGYFVWLLVYRGEEKYCQHENKEKEEKDKICQAGVPIHPETASYEKSESQSVQGVVEFAEFVAVQFGVFRHDINCLLILEISVNNRRSYNTEFTWQLYHGSLQAATFCFQVVVYS